MTKVAVSYEGFSPEEMDKYPDFYKKLQNLLPKGAVFSPYVEEDDEESYYWVVQQNGNDMFVLYDDEGLVEYDEGSEWGTTVNIVLDFMDEVSMELYECPSRLSEDF